MKKWISFLVIILCFGGIAYWQYQEYLDKPENRVTRLVNHTSIQLSKTLAYEIEDSAEGSRGNYGNIFSDLDVNFAEIGKDLLEIRKIDQSKIGSKERLDEAAIYLQKSQAVIKAEYDKYFKLRDYTEALKEVRIGDAVFSVRENINSREIEYMKSKDELVIALKELTKAVDLVDKFISKENLVDKKLIDKIVAKNLKD